MNLDIIDEDNRIDPANMAEIKLILGLRPGDTFIHPDTGESYVIPPHFRVVATRNERGSHHKDRYELPPDYRREFTLGSFEVDYYAAAETYDHFLLPKIMNDDGSISLSAEEVGGNKSRADFSPLLSFALAGETIQAAYKGNKIKNAVFESGFMISALDQWAEMRFKKRTLSDGSAAPASFLNYLETKLLEFVKRPIGNQDRKAIVTILVENGFFFGWKREKFATANEGDIFSEAEFLALMNGKTKIFKDPSSAGITSREVALLDPFDSRKIVIPPHPLTALIKGFHPIYRTFCADRGVRQITFSASTFLAKKDDIAESIFAAMSAMKYPHADIARDVWQASANKPPQELVKSLEKMMETCSKISP